MNCRTSCSASGEAQVSADGATWSPFNVIRGGGAYQVRARQTDWAENTSDWTAVAPLAASERQESSSAIAWSGRWSQHSLETTYGRGYRSTTRGGSTMTTTISASNIQVVAPATLGGGKVRVYLDGALQGPSRSAELGTSSSCAPISPGSPSTGSRSWPSRRRDIG